MNTKAVIVNPEKTNIDTCAGFWSDAWVASICFAWLVFLGSKWLEPMYVEMQSDLTFKTMLALSVARFGRSFLGLIALGVVLCLSLLGRSFVCRRRSSRILFAVLSLSVFGWSVFSIIVFFLPFIRIPMGGR